MKNPLILLPGLLSNEDLWRHQSSHLSDIASIYIFESIEDTPEKMVQAILDKAPDRFALAGHSMGGWLCLEVLKHAKSRISKLCLLNTTARSDSQEKKNRRNQMIEDVRKGKFPKVVQTLVENFVFNAAVKDSVKDMFLFASSKRCFSVQNVSPYYLKLCVPL